MDYVKVLKAGSKVVRAAARYVDRDLHTYYGLAKPAWVSFKGAGVGVLGRSLEVRQVIVGVLSIEFESADKVYMSAVPFEASTKLCNGPNGIPDNLGDGSKEMSLWHDLTWEYAKQIAEILGCTAQEVMQWANGILDAAYRGYGKRRGKNVGWRSRIAYNVCEWSRRWWRMLFPAVVAVALCIMNCALCIAIAGCSGCASPPGWEMEDGSEIEWTEVVGNGQ